MITSDNTNTLTKYFNVVYYVGYVILGALNIGIRFNVGAFILGPILMYLKVLIISLCLIIIIFN